MYESQFQELPFRLSTVTETDFVSEAQSIARTIFPEWDFDTPGDIGWFALRLYIKALTQGVQLSNAWALEANIFTARERSSIISHSRRLGYQVPSQTPARVQVILTVPVSGAVRNFVPYELQMSNRSSVGQEDEIVFENEYAFSVGPGIATVTVDMIAGQTRTQGFTPTTLNNQAVELTETPVLDGSISIDFSGSTWTQVESLVDAGPFDTVFTASLQANGRVILNFGNGITGARPPAGIAGVITYRTGGGAESNLPPDTLRDVITFSEAGSTGTNPLRASGGEASPTNQTIIQRATAQVRQRDFLGTQREIELFSENFSGVARCVASRQGSAVLVFITPDGGGSAAPSLKTALQDAINPRLGIGLSANVDDVQYVTPSVEVVFTTAPGYVSTQMETAIEADIARILSPLTQEQDLRTGLLRWLRQPGESFFVHEITAVLSARANRNEILRDFAVIRPTVDVTLPTLSLTSDIGASINATSRNTTQAGFTAPS